MDAHPGHHRQVTAGGLSHHKQVVGINAKKAWSALAYPGAGLEHVFDDRWQLHLRRQAVVDRHDDVTDVQQRSQERAGPGRHRPAAHHQRAAVNEDDHGPHRLVGRPMHVRLQPVRQRIEGLESKSPHGWTFGKRDQRQGDGRKEMRAPPPTQAREAKQAEHHHTAER
jgi:hypothetical protein